MEVPAVTPNPPRPTRRAVVAAALGAPWLAPMLTGCATSSAANAPVRLGYFANVTHAVPVAAMARGAFASRLGGRGVDPQIFSSGPTAVQAMLAGALDIAYLGPSPAITAWVRTKGRGVRLLSGAAQNGAALVARRGLDSVGALRGRSVSTPQLGGTQDVALKHLLADHHLRVGAGRNDVDVLWMAGSETLDQFRQGRLDASYQAEPWVSRLVLEGGAHVLVDESSLWPGGRFATTSVLVSTDFLRRHPDVVTSLMEAHVETIRWLTTHRTEAQTLLSSEIARLTGKRLKDAVMTRALDAVHFSWDPMLDNLDEIARRTWHLGEIDVRPDLSGFADLDPLDTALRRAGLETVHGRA